MHWVWMNWTPASAFLARRATRISTGSGKGVGRGSDEHLGPHLELLPAQELALVPHQLHRLDELDGVHVEDVRRLGWSPKLLVVAGEAEDVVDAEGGRAQDIALEGDAVPVPGGHLQDRLEPHEL